MLLAGERVEIDELANDHGRVSGVAVERPAIILPDSRALR
jgi:hypothetical protein